MPAAFGPLVAELSDRVAAQFGTRLHSAYLYGSIPRGAATPGRSDLDAVILLRGGPLDADAAQDDVPGADAMAVRRLAAALAAFDQARADLGLGRDPRRLCRSVTRKLVRTGFTLVMPRWNGWTSDLSVMAEVFGQYYPAQADAMAGAAAVAMAPAADAAVITDLIGGLGRWLAEEYGRTIGVKAPRV